MGGARPISQDDLPAEDRSIEDVSDFQLSGTMLEEEQEDCSMGNDSGVPNNWMMARCLTVPSSPDFQPLATSSRRWAACPLSDPFLRACNRVPTASNAAHWSWADHRSIPIWRWWATAILMRRRKRSKTKKIATAAGGGVGRGPQREQASHLCHHYF